MASSEVPRPDVKPDFSLYKFLMNTHGPSARVVLGGSATPALTLTEIISLSSEPEATRQILQDSLFEKRMDLSSDRGALSLREAIASTYDPSVTPDNVLVANGTSGSNHIVERVFLSSADHVIVQYPIYGPCLEEPLHIGCSVSYLRCRASEGWRVNPDELRNLIRPGQTKMIILNNPGNPTGAFIDSDTQRAIIQIAKEHDLIIHCDEIFRPLFHDTTAGGSSQTDTTTSIPPSFAEHPDLAYDKVIVTSSMSKAYGLSGIRIGWITTRSTQLYDQMKSYRMFSIQSLSQLDEAVATEALSPRCRPNILQKHLSLAQRNLDLIEAFVTKYRNQVDWVKPTAGAVAFVRFLDLQTSTDTSTRKGRNDVEFSERLLREKGVLLSPGTLCFRFPNNNDYNSQKSGDAVHDDEEFKGRVRFHFTCKTEAVRAGLAKIAEFLDAENEKKNEDQKEVVVGL